MTNHVRMGIYAITKGTYDELIEQARRGLAPILRDSPGFVFYSTTDVGGGRFVSVSTWETREQAEAAASKSAEWVAENLADSVALEENMIGEMTTLAATERSAVWPSQAPGRRPARRVRPRPGRRYRRFRTQATRAAPQEG
jgi:heme-degrading monooxygenase HmoA